MEGFEPHNPLPLSWIRPWAEESAPKLERTSESDFVTRLSLRWRVV